MAITATRRRFSWTIGILAATCAATANAQLAVYKGVDPEAEPSGQFSGRPNSTTSEQSWTSKASTLGSISKVNFESEGLQENLTKRYFRPGLTLSGGRFHVRNGHGSATEGYNTTATPGSRYVKADSSTSDGSPVIYTFAFNTPIKAFGLNITGVGNRFGGTVSLSFNDGQPRVIPLTNLYNLGGAQFAGFTDAGASISKVTLTLAGSPNNTNAARLVIDDVRWVSARLAPRVSVEAFVPRRADHLLLRR